MSLTLLTAGRIYADLVFTGLDAAPIPGREVFAQGLALAPGGGAFITASYGAALGVPAGLWGVTPAAPFGTCVTEGLARNRVADHTVPPPPGTDPQLTVAIVRSGDRAFLTRRAGPVVPDGPLPSARHLHIGEMTSALDCPGLIGLARQAGMTVSLDCGWDAAMFGLPALATIIASVDLFLPNEAEALRLRQSGVALLPKRALVIKQGAEGATCLAGGRTVTAPARRGAVVDSTGAGDAFNAGFLAAWLDGQGSAGCLALGNRCGAEAVARIGGAEGLTDPDGGISAAAD